MRIVYYRTIRNFWEGDLKRRRHAVRLLLNLREAMGGGERRFNPTLTPEQIEYINWYVKNNEDLPTL
jgi:mono/diheme cytochrome c family protein